MTLTSLKRMAGMAQKVFVANTAAEPAQVAGLVTTSSSKTEPENYIYKLLRRVSGPAGAQAYDLNTESGTGTPAPSVFEWEVPAGREFALARLNFEILDDAIRPTRFGGLGALTNGCLFEIADADDSQILDFTDGVPITINAHFSLLAGVDVPVVDAVGSDLLPIRFTVAKAGAPMIMTAGQKVRWTNRDDLSDMTEFRIMVQGVYTT